VNRALTDSLALEYRLLRNKIESKLETPAVILVTSATDDDGTSLTAQAIAESFSSSNQRTVLVTSDRSAHLSATSAYPGGADIRRFKMDKFGAAHRSSAEEQLSVVWVSPDDIATISHSSVAALLQRLRDEYAFVVVDGPSLPQNPLALLLAPVANGILVAFRSGRQRCPADTSLLESLAESSATMLGVVMSDRATIDLFAERTVNDVPSVAEAAMRQVDHRDVGLRQAGESF
jgi:Mrp family chromosome partitioning ATPase